MPKFHDPWTTHFDEGGMAGIPYAMLCGAYPNGIPPIMGIPIPIPPGHIPKGIAMVLWRLPSLFGRRGAVVVVGMVLSAS